MESDTGMWVGCKHVVIHVSHVMLHVLFTICFFATQMRCCDWPK